MTGHDCSIGLADLLQGAAGNHIACQVLQRDAI